MSRSDGSQSTAFAGVRGTRLKVDNRDRRSIRVAGDGYHVATVSPGMNDPEVYARLFAAAPGLYALVEAVAAGNTEIADLEATARRMVRKIVSGEANGPIREAPAYEILGPVEPEVAISKDGVGHETNAPTYVFKA